MLRSIPLPELTKPQPFYSSSSHAVLTSCHGASRIFPLILYSYRHMLLPSLLIITPCRRTFKLLFHAVISRTTSARSRPLPHRSLAYAHRRTQFFSDTRISVLLSSFLLHESTHRPTFDRTHDVVPASRPPFALKVCTYPHPAHTPPITVDHPPSLPSQHIHLPRFCIVAVRRAMGLRSGRRCFLREPVFYLNAFPRRHGLAQPRGQLLRATAPAPQSSAKPQSLPRRYPIVRPFDSSSLSPHDAHARRTLLTSSTFRQVSFPDFADLGFTERPTRELLAIRR